MKEVDSDNLQNYSPCLADNAFEYPLRRGELILNRFEVKSLLGTGSFGKVIKSYDNVKKTTVAIKVLHNNEGVTRVAKDELMVLKKLRKNSMDKNCPFISLLKCFSYNNFIFMVFPLLNMNLYELIASSGSMGVSLRVVRSIGDQLLEGLSKLREIGIIHCDLKPENIMLVNDNSCQVKIIDFGSATSVYSKVTYTYIQSRFYRAPEILLQLNYKCSIDMWSLAAILAELHCGTPLFQGENEHDQLVQIVNLLGMPPLEMIWNSPMIFRYFEASVSKSNFILVSTKMTKCIPKSYSFDKVFERCRQKRTNSLEHTPQKYDIFYDLLRKMLTIDPQKRIHPSLAKNHPFIDAKNSNLNLEGKLHVAEPSCCFLSLEEVSKNKLDGVLTKNKKNLDGSHSEKYKYVTNNVNGETHHLAYNKEVDPFPFNDSPKKSFCTRIRPIFNCTSNDYSRSKLKIHKNGLYKSTMKRHSDHEDNTGSSIVTSNPNTSANNIPNKNEELNVENVNSSFVELLT